MAGAGRVKRWLGKGLIVALFLGGAFLWVRATFFPPSLENSADRYLACVQSANGGCLMDYMLPQERDSQHITADQLRSLLTSYVLPIYSGVSNPVVTKQPRIDQGSFSLSYRYERMVGPPLVLATTVVATRNGAKVPDLVKDLILLTMFNKYRRSASESKMLAWIRGFRLDGPTLSSLGFTGLYDPSVGRVVDWQTLESVFEQKGLAHGLREKDFR